MPGYPRLAERLKTVLHRDGRLAADLAANGVAVIPYRDLGDDKEPKPVPAVGSYKHILRAEPGPAVEDWLLSHWPPDAKRAWWGILLGPPSNNLVMVDLDSAELAELWGENRVEWSRRATRLAELLAERLPGTCIVVTRRGAHVIARLSPRDWEQAAKRYGGNRRIGTAVLDGTTYDVDLLTLGATPVRSRKHRPAACRPPAVTSLDTLLDAIGFQGAPGEPAGDAEEAALEPPRRLTGSALAEAANLLKPYWREGHRHRLALALAGTLAKAGYSEETAAQLVEATARAADDPELEDRLRAVRDTYRKVRGGLAAEVAGKALLVDELTRIAGSRDKAIQVVEELEELLGRRSPSRVVMSLLRDSGRQSVYAVNDPRRGIVLVKMRDGEVVGSHAILTWYVDSVEAIRGSDVFETYRVRLRRAGDGTVYADVGDVEEIAQRLRRLAGVKARSLLADALSAVIDEMISRGAGRVLRLEAGPGIYPRGRLVLEGVNAVLETPRDPDPEKARRALRLLARLRASYRDPRKFDAAILWAAYAPASYSYKLEYGVKQVYLMLHGERQTGKTTLARIISAMYPLRSRELGDVPEEGQTEYRLAWKLDLATVPVVEDEVQGISGKKSLIGLLKRAATGVTVRWRGDTGRAYRARAPLVITSNYRETLEDDALRERILAVEFTAADRPDKSRVAEFRTTLAEYRQLAPHLGAVVLMAAAEEWERLAQTYRTIYEPWQALAAGAEVWKSVAQRLGLGEEELPWLGLDPASVDVDPAGWGEEEALLTVVKRALSDAMSRARLASPGSDPEAAVKAVAVHLPAWIAPARSGLAVSAGVLAELRRLGVEPVGGLRGLAERLGYRYATVKVGGRNRRAMILPWETVAALLSASVEE